MLDFMDRRQRKANQPHICRFCGEKITPGQYYIRMCSSRKGRITTLCAHIPCDALSIAYGREMEKQECSGTDVEAWIRRTICFRCGNAESCTASPFRCTNVLDGVITDAGIRRAIDDVEKWDIIHQISLWKKSKYDKDYLADMMEAFRAKNLQEITTEQAEAYYQEHIKAQHESEGLCYGR